MESTPSRVLYVYIPGIGSDRSERMRQLIEREAQDRARSAGGSAELVVFPHHVKAWTIRRRLHPGPASDRLNAFIARTAGFSSSDSPRASEIVIVAHSLGGLIARSAWLKSRGYDFSERQETGVISRNDDRWAAITSRIVLLGVPNGGFALRKGSFWWWIYQLATPWADFAIEDASAGAYWVANLRLRWLAAFRDLPPESLPYVVQVLGSDDGLVKDADLGDTDFLPATITVEMDDADHAGLIELPDRATENARWGVLKSAIFGRQTAPPVRQPKPDPVVFILHGIRASNSDPWVTQMTEHLSSLGMHVIAPNTGFFSAWEFFLPFSRNKKSHEFLRYYGDAARDFDPDNFVLLGHSNGTYMVGRSMHKTPAVRFHRMLLAGTVLEPDYPWQLLVRRQQIGRHERVDGGTEWKNGVVHNERARRDWPVGVLCNLVMGLRPLNRMVGPGGVVGFVGVDEQIVTKDDRVFDGGHGAALKTSAGNRKEQIATFLTTGTYDDEPPVSSSAAFQFVGRLMYWLAWPLVLLLAVLLAAVGVRTVLNSGWLAALSRVGAPVASIYALLRWL